MHYGFHNWTLGAPIQYIKKASKPVIQGRLPNAFCRKTNLKKKIKAAADEKRFFLQYC